MKIARGILLSITSLVLALAPACLAESSLNLLPPIPYPESNPHVAKAFDGVNGIIAG